MNILISVLILIVCAIVGYKLFVQYLLGVYRVDGRFCTWVGYLDKSDMFLCSLMFLLGTSIIYAITCLVCSFCKIGCIDISESALVNTIMADGQDIKVWFDGEDQIKTFEGCAQDFNADRIEFIKTIRHVNWPIFIIKETAKYTTKIK